MVALWSKTRRFKMTPAVPGQEKEKKIAKIGTEIRKNTIIS